jgi:hypothetical protein
MKTIFDKYDTVNVTDWMRPVPWYEALWYKTLRGWKGIWGPRALKRRVVKAGQRITRGWADEDTWSFDWYLNRVIFGGVMRLREDAHGYPSQLLPSESPIALPPSGTYVYSLEEDTQHMIAWKNILLQIARGFAAKDLLNSSVHFGKDLFTGQYVLDKDLEAKLRSEVDKGMALFVKYYDALWD